VDNDDRETLFFWVLIVGFWVLINFIISLPRPFQVRSAAITEPNACPQAQTRLNVYEYELQRRTCEAVRSGAIIQAARRR